MRKIIFNVCLSVMVASAIALIGLTTYAVENWTLTGLGPIIVFAVLLIVSIAGTEAFDDRA